MYLGTVITSFHLSSFAAGLNPTGRDTTCGDMTRCPPGRIRRRSGALAAVVDTNRCRSGNGPRIIVPDDLEGGDRRSGSQSSGCPEDSLCCCYDSELELQQAAGPICDGPVSSQQLTSSDWRLLNCEESEYEEELLDYDLALITRGGSILDGRLKTCGQRGGIIVRSYHYNGWSEPIRANFLR